MKILFKSPEIEVPEGSPFQNDKLHFKEKVTNITELLKNISSPMVLSINAPWGCGKTTFLKMVNADLRKKGGTTIFFSAWETDFVDDPLLAFLGEINQQLSSIMGEDVNKKETLQKVMDIGSEIFKIAVPALVKAVTGGAVDVGEATKDLVDKYMEGKGQITIFKENLGKLVSDVNGKKIYIFVDELDRCKPTYAIHLLERIKHLLGIEGIVFVLAMDKLQLSHSIRGVYGNGFDAIGYLRRFIDIEYTLPQPELNNFIDHLFKEYNFQRISNLEGLKVIFKSLASSNNLSLREIEQYLAKINLVLYATKGTLYPELLVFLLFVKERHVEIYREYIKENITPANIIELLGKLVPEKNSLGRDQRAVVEAYLIAAKYRRYDENHIIDAHNKVINDEAVNAQERQYSQCVVLEYEWVINNRGNDFSLRNIVSQLEMLEGFTFPAAAIQTADA